MTFQNCENLKISSRNVAKFVSILQWWLVNNNTNIFVIFFPEQQLDHNSLSF